jgi:DNA-directed RNA polymerase subunit RPC12/RpoP
MRYKCVSCGIEFATIEHLAGPRNSTGAICLGCGKSIPLEPSKANYSGPLTCPNCNRTMSVVIEDGEVAVARLG